PVVVEMLSRFRTQAQQTGIIRKLAEGSVDIIIGTHRLVQKDVAFKDLGLVIIDEEQRFGVEHKEHLKHMRQLVDVLTLTATPIPRTLYMSLTGARDMSTIQSPPQERQPIQTQVIGWDEPIIRRAILREMNRGGQVFFLHNRVMTLENMKRKLQKVVPEARIETGHGQMRERELESVMQRFVRGEFDVLLCTTIIESGVDIPNANTILIDRADRFGMADLYQLRGRVGRSKQKAYAYLLLSDKVYLYDSARQRIKAIQKYSTLGAGFKIALQDLEIRGAGNLLGAEQSGHIAAVGFDLYCQFLKRTIAVMKGEAPPPVVDVDVRLDFLDLSPSGDGDDSAMIPYDYMEDENARLSAYRRMAGAAWEKELDTLQDEFRDRFGPIPDPLIRLLKVSRIRILAAHLEVNQVECRKTRIMLLRHGDYLRENSRFPRTQGETAGEMLDAMIETLRTFSTPT
ncbi:MAG: TRCF domain-containing protein, partial [Verrucomicrobiota bacterium]